MANDLERVRRILEQAEEFTRSYRFEMTDDYREMIARVEAMPRNQSGAAKSSRWLGSYADAVALRNSFKPAPRT